MSGARQAILLAPGGMVHDFANRSDRPARFLNITTPGGFEVGLVD